MTWSYNSPSETAYEISKLNPRLLDHTLKDVYTQRSSLSPFQYPHQTLLSSVQIPLTRLKLSLLSQSLRNVVSRNIGARRSLTMEDKGGSGNPAWQQQWVEWTNVLPSSNTQCLLICLGYVIIFAYHGHSRTEKSLALALHILAATFEPKRYYLPSSNTQYLLICLGYVIIFAYHTRHSISAYYGHSRTEKSLALALHILAATFELTRYYFRAFRRTVQPDLFDTAACMIHSITSLRLARTLRRGDKTTRASYQAPAMLRPVLSFAAVVRQDAFAHEACVKLLHAFLYTRLLIFVAKRIGLGKIQSHSTIYARAVTLGAILAIRSSGLPAGVPIYVGAVGLVMVFNQQTPSNLPSSVHLMDGIERRPDTRVIRPTSVKRTKEKVEQAVTKVIQWLGLFEIKGFEMKHLSPTIPAGDIDEYTEQKLAAT
ncbi:Uncharacterized protein HZ326_28472 [Fusarium oxysporum f. sp. albedinis]|nr:Uncharacterized protein HZ326_28472 [Fusarium oxysporum f. sp. albedinis]